MNLPGGTTISPLLLGALVLTCAAPAITLNVWPRVETMLAQGLTSNQVGTALLVGVSALAMTAVPFAMAKSPNRGFWWTSLVFGLSLAVLNYIMAVGAIGKVSDDATQAAAATISRIKSLQDQLEELRADRRQLGAFKPTTQAQLEAATEAVRLAEDARKQECDKVGDFCRARVAQLQSRLSERADVAAALATSLRVLELDRRIGELRSSLAAAGTAPSTTNPQAERIKSVIRWAYPDVATDSVATGIIHFLAIMSELFALLAPRVLATALARSPESPSTSTRHLAHAPAARLGEIVSWAKRPFLVAKTEAPRLEPPKPQPPAVGSKPQASQLWREQHLMPAPGNRLRTWDAYKHYEAWTKANGQTPASFTSFDYEMQLLGVVKETGPRSVYVNVNLRQPLKVVA